MYYGARYYDPWVGRFLSQDPALIGNFDGITFGAIQNNPQQFNAYTYALNAPTRYTDPTGAIATSCTPTGGGGYTCTPVGGSSGGTSLVAFTAVASRAGPVGVAVALAATAYSLAAGNLDPLGATLNEASNNTGDSDAEADEAKASGKATATDEPSDAAVKKIERQLAEHGRKSVEKSRKSLEKKLGKHREDFERYGKEDGPTSSIAREIRAFENELKAIDKVLGR